MFEALTDGKINSIKYREDLHTFELQIVPKGSTTPITTLFDKKHFPKHAAYKILDESVQVYDEVKVLLKTEAELRLGGWQFSKFKKRLKSKESPFIIGDKKKKLLGSLYPAKVGITEDHKPFVFFDKYRFSPSEIKCIIKADDLKEQKATSVKKRFNSPINQTYNYGYGTYHSIIDDSNSGRLVLPINDVRGEHIQDLIHFLKLTGWIS